MIIICDRDRFERERIPSRLAMVSSAEARYIIDSCLDDFRIDGRSRIDHRPYAISNRRSSSSSLNSISNGKKSFITNTTPDLVLSNGSSRIHLPGSATDVLCSVKADLVHPSPSRPDAGVCELSVDLSLCGDVLLSSGGGSGGAGGAARRRRRQDESELSSLLTRLILPHAVDYKKMVVWAGRYVWRLSIDIVILRADGCVLDACSMAIRAALIDARLPRVKAVIDGNTDDGRGGKNEMMGGEFGGAGGGMGGKNDLLVDGDISRARPPPGAESCPLIVTISVLRAPLPMKNNGAMVQYRSIPIVDARTEEEVCATIRVCVSVDPKGIVCGVHTLGGGGSALSEEEDTDCRGGGGSLPLAMLSDVVTSAAMASRNLYTLLNDGDGSRTNISCKSKDVHNDGGGYGYLLKNHVLIR